MSPLISARHQHMVPGRQLPCRSRLDDRSGFLSGGRGGWPAAPYRLPAHRRGNSSPVGRCMIPTAASYTPLEHHQQRGGPHLPLSPYEVVQAPQDDGDEHGGTYPLPQATEDVVHPLQPYTRLKGPEFKAVAFDDRGSPA